MNRTRFLVASTVAWLAFSSTGAAQQPPTDEQPAPEEQPAAQAVPAEAEAVPAPPPPPEPEAEPPAEIEFNPGEGVQIASGDGQFALTLRTFAQVLALIAAPEVDLGPDAGAGDVYSDFGAADFRLSLRRARIYFQGWIFGRDNRFKIQLGLSPSDMVLRSDGTPTRSPVLDWYFEFRQLRELNVRVGQGKVPFNRERIVSSSEMQMVDRSISNAEFNLDRDMGIWVGSTDFLGLDLLRYWAGISTGEGRDGGFGTDLGFTYVARVEVLPLGMFEDYAQADFERNVQPRLALGAAYAFVHEAARNRGILGTAFADGGTANFHAFTADAVFMWMGASVNAEVIVRTGDRNAGMALDAMGNPVPVELPRNGIGWFVQAGYLLPFVDHLEVSARWGMIHPLGDAIGPIPTTAIAERGELGAAVSYYFQGHPFKLQLDYFHLWNDGDFGDSEDRVRLQLQATL